MEGGGEGVIKCVPLCNWCKLRNIIGMQVNTRIFSPFPLVEGF